MHVLAGSPPTLPRPQRWVLPLLESRHESPTAMTFRFSTQGTGFHYLSNQAIRLALPGVDDPWGAVRSFSMSSSPSEPGQIAVTCKISDTPFKQALARLGRAIRPRSTARSAPSSSTARAPASSSQAGSGSPLPGDAPLRRGLRKYRREAAAVLRTCAGRVGVPRRARSTRPRFPAPEGSVHGNAPRRLEDEMGRSRRTH